MRVRGAIDREHPPGDQHLTRAAAAEALLTYDPPDGPEPDWEQEKQRLLDELNGGR